jgi:tetratricopeptide (TPR) repeat protein
MPKRSSSDDPVQTGSGTTGRPRVHAHTCPGVANGKTTGTAVSVPGPEEECHQQLACTQPPAECFICLEGHGLLLRGCACRGSAGFVHLSCMVTAAQANGARWHTCPTCEQRWTGRLKLAIARARYDLLVPRSAGADGEVLQAAMDLTWALRESCQLDEALKLGIKTLATARRTSGDEHVTTLTAMGILASVYGAVGDHAAALPLETHVLAVRRRLLGNDHHATLSTVTNLGVTHLQLGNHAAALPLIHEALEGGRRPRDHPETLTSIGNLGTLYSSIGTYDLALPLVQEALDGRRRVLGDLHPDTLHSVGGLGILLCKMGDHTGAAELLQEAVAGFATVYGELHPLSRRCRLESEHNHRQQDQRIRTERTQAERDC